MRRALPWVMLAVTVFWSFFIWHFSLADGSESAATSGAVLESINGAFSKIGADAPFSALSIRKTGHFVEFFVLGALASVTLLLFGFGHFTTIALGAVLLVACVDELLQIFSPGRGPSFADVGLDTAGGACGALLFCVAVLTIRHLRARKKRKKSENHPKTS